MGGFCAFDGRGLVWLFVLVFCCCFSTTIIIYFYIINDKYVTREGFTEHILPGDEGVRDFFPVMFFVLGVSLFALRSSLRCFRDAVFFFLSGFFVFLRAFACGVPPVVVFFVCTVFFLRLAGVFSVRFPVVRRGTGVFVRLLGRGCRVRGSPVWHPCLRGSVLS